MKHNHPIILAYGARMTPRAPQAMSVQEDKTFSVRVNEKPHPYGVKPVTPVEVLNLSDPKWIESPSLIEELKKSYGSAVYEPCDGYYTEGGGRVRSSDTSLAAGVISAIAVNYDTENEKVNTAPAHIVNTENGGFRYVHCTQDGKMYDIGPVINTCFVGNLERPEGIYIPLANTKAIADGLDMIQNVMGKRIETGKGMDESDPCFGCRMNCTSCFHADPDPSDNDF